MNRGEVEKKARGKINSHENKLNENKLGGFGKKKWSKGKE